MKKLKSKTMTILIAILFILSMTASMLLVPTARAQVQALPKDITTYAYINALPNPIGVNQSVFVIMWLDKVFGEDSSLTNNWRFHNYEFTITAPDGTKTTQTFAICSDPTAAQDTTFTPSAVGTYTLTFTFPGQAYDQYPGQYNPDSPLVGDTFLPSSASTNVTVQSTPIPGITISSPLPTSYWTRPIYGENNYWFAISSNWLGAGAPVESSAGSGDEGGYGVEGAILNVNPGDAVGSLTNHIMWTKPIQQGGVVGGNDTVIQGDTYFEGSAYDARYTNPIIMDGMLYYQAPLSFLSSYLLTPDTSGTYCVNLQTGQQVWESNSIPADQLWFGYIYDEQGPNQKGVLPPVLFTYNFAEAFDAYTGQWLFNVTNAPGGGLPVFGGALPEVLGPNGEHLRYAITNEGTASNPDYYLAQWNSTNLWNWNVGVGGGTPYPNYVPVYVYTYIGGVRTFVPGPNNGTVNGAASSMYNWNISMSDLNSYNSITELYAFYNNMIICLNGTFPVESTNELNYGYCQAPYQYFAINLDPSRGAVGSILWAKTYDAPPGNVTITPGPCDPTTGVFTEGYTQTMQWVGYSMSTGNRLWGPTPSQTALDYYGNPGAAICSGTCAYGNLYSVGYAGMLWCYNDLTGDVLWTYGNGGAGNSTYSGYNGPFGHYPTFINAIGNGVIYTVTSEHTVNTPIYKGALARAINATTGQQIWTISDYTGDITTLSYAMADGYNTWFNGYDNQIYVVGRGPSATTVTAPQTAITEGNNVIIQGTVMDISAGTTQTEQAADFPHGVPCASDASMAAWMGYVYQQQPEPTNFTGVTVTLTAIDSNGNFITLGTATTDATGHFIYAWQTPQVPGKYTVTATFAGTNSYWPSNDETGLFVQNAASTPAPTATPVTGLASTGSLELGIAAVIVVIIIIGAAIMLMLRKRP